MPYLEKVGFKGLGFTHAEIDLLLLQVVLSPLWGVGWLPRPIVQKSCGYGGCQGGDCHGFLWQYDLDSHIIP